MNSRSLNTKIGVEVMRFVSLSKAALMLALGSALLSFPQSANAKQRVELNDYQKQWGFSPLVGGGAARGARMVAGHQGR